MALRAMCKYYITYRHPAYSHWHSAGSGIIDWNGATTIGVPNGCLFSIRDEFSLNFFRLKFLPKRVFSLNFPVRFTHIGDVKV